MADDATNDECRSCAGCNMTIMGSTNDGGDGVMAVAANAVVLSPCGCRFCKDCYLQFLADTRLQAILLCASCGTAVVSHRTSRRALTQTAVVAEEVVVAEQEATVEHEHYYIHKQQHNNNSKQQRLPPPSTVTATTTTTLFPSEAFALQGTSSTTTASSKSSKKSATASSKTSSSRRRPTTTTTTSPARKKAAAVVAASSKNNKKRQLPTKKNSAMDNNNNNDNDESSSQPKIKKRKRRRLFDDYVDELLAYKSQHGDCWVPYNYSHNKALGRWVSDIRNGHKQLTEEQRLTLDAVGGFPWRPSSSQSQNNNNNNNNNNSQQQQGDDNDNNNEIPTTKKKVYKIRRSFDERLQELQAFKNKHGHCYVPYRHSTTLGEWVKDIRRGHLKVTKEQRKQLNAIGFIWETKTNRLERQWNDRLERLKAYKQQYGHCHVPWNWELDKQLSAWCNDQRKQNNKGKLRADRKKILDAIGFVWGGGGGGGNNDDSNALAGLRDDTIERQWNDRLERLKAYKKQYGHCHVPWNWELDKQLSAWCNDQRKQNNKGKLRADRKKMLDSIGFVWGTGGGGNNDDSTRKALAGLRDDTITTTAWIQSLNNNDSDDDKEQQEGFAAAAAAAAHRHYML